MAEQARREDSERAERMLDIAERRENAAARRADLAEQARREDSERAARMLDAVERRADAAERREQLLLELIASLKNGKDNGSE